MARPIDGGVTVRRATIDEIVALRHVELRPGRPQATAVFDGDDAPTTTHVAALCHDEVVGCASFVQTAPGPPAAYQLRGMATRADLIGQGIGRQVLSFGLTVLRAENPAVALWCNARVGAVGFYERLGWRVTSDVFEVPDVGPHRRMAHGAG